VPGKSRRPYKPPLGQLLAVLVAALAACFALSLRLISNQRASLVQGLVQRVDMLLAQLSSAAANNLSPNLENLRQLNSLRDQAAAAMPEVRYFTLTGYGLDDPGRFDFLWVSSDPEIGVKARGSRFTPVNYGRIKLEDEIAAEVERLAAAVNEAAAQRVGAIAGQLDLLGAEAVRLIRSGDALPVRLRQLDAEIFDLNRRIYFELQDIRGKARSFPPLDPHRPPRKMAASYLFYLPVVYRQRGEQAYFRGAVRLAIGTERLRIELAGLQRRLLIQLGIAAVVAFGLGLTMAFAALGAGTISPAARRRRGGRHRVRKEERS
jgi:hypothetical protein